jgi:hypothetical protein
MRLALEEMNETLSNPAVFAAAIRTLARDAHQLRQSPTAAVVWGLSRRIERLASALGDRRGGPLGTWLDNLGREVRSNAVQWNGSTGATCRCA